MFPALPGHLPMKPKLRRPKPNQRQLGEQRRRHLVAAASRLLRVGDPPSLFRWEGSLIAAIRSMLVLRGGWRWRDADTAARDVVLEALRTVGAKRPTWAEASTPHYAQGDAFSLIERTRCRRCGGRLPPENRVYCSQRCCVALSLSMRCAEQAAIEAAIAEGLGQ